MRRYVLKGQMLIILAILILISIFITIPSITKNNLVIYEETFNSTLDYKVSIILLDLLAYTTNTYSNYNYSILNSEIKQLIEEYSDIIYKYYNYTINSTAILVNTNIPCTIRLYETDNSFIRVDYSDTSISIVNSIFINTTITPTIISQPYYILAVNVTHYYLINNFKLLTPVIKAYILYNNTIIYGYIERIENDFYTIYFPLYNWSSLISEIEMHLEDYRGVHVWCIISVV